MRRNEVVIVRLPREVLDQHALQSRMEVEFWLLYANRPPSRGGGDGCQHDDFAYARPKPFKRHRTPIARGDEHCALIIRYLDRSKAALDIS